MTKIIELIISPTGESRIETKGFQGASCQLASQFLENALGAKQSERLTTEFYAAETNRHQLQEGRQ